MPRRFLDQSYILCNRQFNVDGALCDSVSRSHINQAAVGVIICSTVAPSFLCITASSPRARNWDSFQLSRISLLFCVFFLSLALLSVLLLSMTSFRQATNGCPHHIIHPFCLSSRLDRMVGLGGSVLSTVIFSCAV